MRTRSGGGVVGVFLFTAPLTLSGCGDKGEVGTGSGTGADGGDDSGGDSGSGTDSGATGSDCSEGSGLTAGSDTFLDVDGASAWVLVPNDLPACAPLVVFGHGGSSPGGYLDGKWKDALRTQFDVLAGEQGYVFVVPYLEDTDQVDHQWSLEQTTELAAMVAAVAEQADVDQNRVLFAGQSAGGHMAVYLGLYDWGPFTHIAAVSSGIGAYFDYPDPPPDQKLPFFVAHDPDDEIVPYSYSEQLVSDLEANGHDHVYSDFEMGDNGHFWSEEVTTSLLGWFLGEEAER